MLAMSRNSNSKIEWTNEIDFQNFGLLISFKIEKKKKKNEGKMHWNFER